MATNENSSRLMVLMFTDMVDSLKLKVELGDAEYVEQIAKPYNAIFREILARFPDANENNYTGDGFLATFDSVNNAVNAALLFHHALRTARWKFDRPSTRTGIHLGETVLFEGPDANTKLIASSAADMCARIMGLGSAGQTLMTRAAFDNARQYIRDHPATGDEPKPELQWMAHGKYVFQGSDEPVEVCEVGAVGFAPLQSPAGSDKARCATTVEEEATLGWRPANGLAVPGRHGWTLQRKLGEGSFGEVWLARHEQTREKRVFKFCFDAIRLRHFKRELTVFRLLREVLGDRDDIARILEVQLDEQPFFLESEYVEAGNLSSWAESQGGLAQVPLATRIGLIARVARAVAAAHSGGIIHKDIKPTNIFIVEQTVGAPRPVLADFGIGAIADRAILQEKGISAGGFTEAATLLGDESGSSGTRLYKPPESLIGKPATTAGDIYALGVMLYQMVVADLGRPLAIGWEKLVLDPLLQEDITACTHGDPNQRLDSATDLAQRLESLKQRRAEREERRRAEMAQIKAVQRAADYKRRLKTMRISLAVVLFFLITLGTLLFQINRERKNAIMHSKQARALADEFFTQVSESKLMNVSGLQPLRRDLLKSALVYYQGFVDRPASGARVEEYEDYLAAAYFRLGIITSEIGSKQEAFSHFENAIEIRQRLVKEHTSVAKYQSDLAVSYANLGVLQTRTGKLRDAASSLSRAVEIQQRLIAKHPEVDEYDNDMALIYHDLGLLQSKSGALDDAAASYQEAIATRERIADRNPGDSRHVANLATSYNNLGAVQAESFRLGDAAISIEKAIEIQEPLLKENPKNIRYQHELAGSYNNLANLQSEIGHPDEAVSTYRKAIEVQKLLALENPLVVECQANLGTNYSNLGMLQAEVGRLSDAIASFEQAVSIQEQVAAKDPDVGRYRMSLAESYSNVGMLMMEVGKPDDAAAAFRKAIEIRQRLAAEHRDLARYQSELAIGYNNLGILESETGHFDDAAAAFRQAIEIQQRLAAENPTEDQYQSELAIGYNNLGILESEAGNLHDAAALFRKAIEIQQRLAAANPNVERHRDELADSYKKLGIVDVRTGNLVEAVSSFRKLIEIREKRDGQPPVAAADFSRLPAGYVLHAVGRVVMIVDDILQACRRIFDLSLESGDEHESTSAQPTFIKHPAASRAKM